MKALCIVLTICLSCSMFETVFEPVVEVVEKSAKPLTIGAAVWLMVELVNPAAAAIIAGAFTAFWDTTDAELHADEAKEREAETQSRNDAYFLAIATGETAPLKNLIQEREESDAKLKNWLLVAAAAYILKQPLWSYLDRRRRRKEIGK